VVEILDIDETEDGNAFLVMELLDGETLADRAERMGKLEPKPLLVLVDQLLDVLVACHRKGIIHRDIKPENLFIQRDGKLKVLDFGIARMREGVRTQAGTMLGTVAFIPPEQLKGLDVDARADLFGVGATMFSVLTGRRIHLSKSDSELAIKMLTTPAPALASVLEDVDENLAMVVDRALAFLPPRRYPDAVTMRGDVWALQRSGRPPYANACEQAGQDPRVVELPTDAGTPTAKAGARVAKGAAAELPATDPQMPVFAASGIPSTDPQMPVFASAVAPADQAGQGPLPSTKPELPAFVDDEGASDDAVDEEASDEAASEPDDAVDEEASEPDDAVDEEASEPDEDEELDEQEPEDQEPEDQEPEDQEPEDQEEPKRGSHKTDKGWPASPAKPARAAAKRAARPVDDDAPDSDAPDSDAPDDDERDSDAPRSDDEPSASARKELSEAGSDAPAARSLGSTMMFFLVGVAAVLAIAWWAGLLPGR